MLNHIEPDDLAEAEYEDMHTLPSGVANPADAFRNIFAILHNLDRDELVGAGLFGDHDDDKWARFNSNLTTFVLKLDDAKLDALYALIQELQPERHRDPVGEMDTLRYCDGRWAEERGTMMDGIQAVKKVRDGYADQARFADVEPASHFREFVRRLDDALSTGMTS